MLSLFSCTGNTGDASGDGALLPDTKYATSDYSCVMELSDGVRTVVLESTLERGIVNAKIISPDEMSGVSITHDESGTSIVTGGDTLSLGDDNGGLSVIFDSLRHEPSENERKLGAKIKTETNGFISELILDEAGYPRQLDITKGEYKRCVMFSKWETRE